MNIEIIQIKNITVELTGKFCGVTIGDTTWWGKRPQPERDDKGRFKPAVTQDEE